MCRKETIQVSGSPTCAADLGGSVSIDSSPGRGTRVLARIPVEAPTVENAAPAAGPTSRETASQLSQEAADSASRETASQLSQEAADSASQGKEKE